MPQMNISLPETLKAFVDDQAAAEGYSSASAYLHALIQREQDVHKFRTLIREGLESGPGVVADEAYFEDLKARLRADGAA